MSNDTKLKDRAILVGLNISCWQGSRIDLKASEKTVKQYDASTSAGAFTKRLFPKSERLQEISRSAQHMREWFRDTSLPWIDGFRVIPSERMFEVSKQFQIARSDFHACVAEFISNYEEEKKAAQIRLGRLYNELDYPPTEKLEELFSARISVVPIPEQSDYRTEIPEEIIKDMEDRAKEAERNALKENIRQVRETVLTALNKLSDTDSPVFRNSLIQNIVEELQLAQIRDFGGDNEKVFSDLEKVAEKLSPDSIRASEKSKSEAVGKLSEIDKKLKELKLFESGRSSLTYTHPLRPICTCLQD